MSIAKLRVRYSCFGSKTNASYRCGKQDVTLDALRKTVATEKMKTRNANIALAVANAILIAVLILIAFHLLGKSEKSLDIQGMLPVPESSDFVLSETPQDINPGKPLVLYTNYACPYCAEFYELTEKDSYTTRLLILEKDSQRFASQREVSSYMLKLYREDVDAYRQLESYLFAYQDEWTTLEAEELIGLLNEKSGKAWSLEDLETEIEELEATKTKAPVDLQYVPALYSDGLQYSQFVLGLVG